MENQPAPSTPNPEVQDQTPRIQQPIQEKELLVWNAPARLFKRRSREFYTTVAALVFLLSVILFFAKEFLLIGVILAFGFVSYVMASVPPEMIEHKLTNKGIRTDEKLFAWEMLARYWWLEKWHQTYVTIETPGRVPSTIILLEGKGKKEEIDAILKQFLINEKPQPTWFDKAAKWLQEKIPLESE